MKKHEGAISDCKSALSINPKCTRSISQNGHALLALGLFDKAEECYESLRPLGEGALADTYLKKLHSTQERVQNYVSGRCRYVLYNIKLIMLFNSICLFLSIQEKLPKPAGTSCPKQKTSKKRRKKN